MGPKRWARGRRLWFWSLGLGVLIVGWLAAVVFNRGRAWPIAFLFALLFAGAEILIEYCFTLPFRPRATSPGRKRGPTDIEPDPANRPSRFGGSLPDSLEDATVCPRIGMSINRARAYFYGPSGIYWAKPATHDDADEGNRLRTSDPGDPGGRRKGGPGRRSPGRGLPDLSRLPPSGQVAPPGERRLHPLAPVPSRPGLGADRLRVGRGRIAAFPGVLRLLRGHRRQDVQQLPEVVGPEFEGADREGEGGPLTFMYLTSGRGGSGRGVRHHGPEVLYPEAGRGRSPADPMDPIAAARPDLAETAPPIAPDQLAGAFTDMGRAVGRARTEMGRFARCLEAAAAVMPTADRRGHP
jgi:hypothetical protein